MFCALHGTKWSELLRLPYFDPIRMVVIDPMHNILLGEFMYYVFSLSTFQAVDIMKTQWFDGWIKKRALRGATATKVERELDSVHDYLNLVRQILFWHEYMAYNLLYFILRDFRRSSSFPRLASLRCPSGSADYLETSGTLQAVHLPRMSGRPCFWYTCRR